eukprot:1138351-Pelagomonas_calceolata.AAC.6
MRAHRNMHLTTTLISAFPGSRPHAPTTSSSTAANADSSFDPPPASNSGTDAQYLPPGVLAISSNSLLLLTLPMHPHIDSSTGAGAARKLELLRYSMVGVPTCKEVVWRETSGTAVVGAGSAAGMLEMVLIVADTMAGACMRACVCMCVRERVQYQVELLVRNSFCVSRAVVSNAWGQEGLQISLEYLSGCHAAGKDYGL